MKLNIISFYSLQEFLRLENIPKSQTYEIANQNMDGMFKNVVISNFQTLIYEVKHRLAFTNFASVDQIFLSFTLLMKRSLPPCHHPWGECHPSQPTGCDCLTFLTGWTTYWASWKMERRKKN